VFITRQNVHSVHFPANENILAGRFWRENTKNAHSLYFPTKMFSNHNAFPPKPASYKHSAGNDTSTGDSDYGRFGGKGLWRELLL